MLVSISSLCRNSISSLGPLKKVKFSAMTPLRYFQKNLPWLVWFAFGGNFLRNNLAVFLSFIFLSLIFSCSVFNSVSSKSKVLETKSFRRAKVSFALIGGDSVGKNPIFEARNVTSGSS